MSAAVLPLSGKVLHLSMDPFEGMEDGRALSTGWPDASGHGHDAVPGAAPTYVADAGDGWPAIRFDGDDQLLTIDLPTGSAASVFLVFAHQRSSALANHRETLLSATGSGPRLNLVSSRSVTPAPDYPTFEAVAGSGLAVQTWLDGLASTDATGDGFTGRFYVGSAVFTALPAATSLILGASDTFGGHAGRNDLREVIIYDRALDNAERQAVQRYLGRKHDIALLDRDLDHPVEAYNYVLGSQQFGTGYGYGQSENRILNAARQFYRQGNRVFKTRLSRRYFTSDDFSFLSSVNSLATLAQHPEMKAILDMPFRHLLFWTSSFAVPSWQNRARAAGVIDESAWTGFYGADRSLYAPDTYGDPTKAPTPLQGLDPSAAQQIYTEVYDLAVYLLETYSGSGKSFYIGNWEGDWMLSATGTYLDQAIPPERLQAMIDWANTRQRAVDDAKAATPHSDVDVWFYLEMNKADWMRDGWICVANTVVPALDKLDFLSVSSYSVHKDGGVPAPRSRVHSDLDQIAAKIAAKTAAPDVTGSRVIIGEYGFQYNSNHRNLADLTRANIDSLQDFLTWPGGTLRFILQWQFFDDVLTDSGNPKEFAQIGNQKDRRPGYFLHENFYREMRRWVDDRYRRDGVLPEPEAFEHQAVALLAEISLEAYRPQLEFTHFDDWVTFNFPDFGDRADPRTSGPEADPEKSGFPNLLRYGLGWNRHEANLDELPELRFPNGLPTLAIPSRPAKADLAWVVEGSSDLQAWPTAYYDSRLDNLTPVEGWLEIPATPENGNPLFLRLSAEPVP